LTVERGSCKVLERREERSKSALQNTATEINKISTLSHALSSLLNINIHIEALSTPHASAAAILNKFRFNHHTITTTAR
jgi:hypothetical protein